MLKEAGKKPETGPTGCPKGKFSSIQPLGHFTGFDGASRQKRLDGMNEHFSQRDFSKPFSALNGAEKKKVAELAEQEFSVFETHCLVVIGI